MSGNFGHLFSSTDTLHWFWYIQAVIQSIDPYLHEIHTWILASLYPAAILGHEDRVWVMQTLWDVCKCILFSFRSSMRYWLHIRLCCKASYLLSHQWIRKAGSLLSCKFDSRRSSQFRISDASHQRKWIRCYPDSNFHNEESYLYSYKIVSVYI